MREVENLMSDNEMGKGWMLWFKTTLVFLPMFMTLVFGWGVWVTKNQFADNAFRSAGPRYTQEQAARERESTRLLIQSELQSLELKIVDVIGRLPTLRRQEMLEASMEEIQENQAAILQRLRELSK